MTKDFEIMQREGVKVEIEWQTKEGQDGRREDEKKKYNEG
jgi:hypothetical protein